MQLMFSIISTATTYMWVKLSFLKFIMEVPEREWDVMEHGTPALSAAHPTSGQHVSSHSNIALDLVHIRLPVSNDIHIRSLAICHCCMLLLHTLLYYEMRD